MLNTIELGPRLNSVAPEFSLLNHEHRESNLCGLMGKKGLLLGFTGDIWQPASVRRILWLQRQHSRFVRQGINVALLICDKPHMLYGFYMSSVMPLGFPLLADPDRAVHVKFSMERHAGLILIDSNGIIRDKWLVPDERVWPNAQELQDAFHRLH
jgi:peroxiredoxin